MLARCKVNSYEYLSWSQCRSAWELPWAYMLSATCYMSLLATSCLKELAKNWQAHSWAWQSDCSFCFLFQGCMIQMIFIWDTHLKNTMWFTAEFFHLCLKDIDGFPFDLVVKFFFYKQIWISNRLCLKSAGPHPFPLFFWLNSFSAKVTSIVKSNCTNWTHACFIHKLLLDF